MKQRGAPLVNQTFSRRGCPVESVWFAFGPRLVRGQFTATGGARHVPVKVNYKSLGISDVHRSA
jgi:hypothetical protein